VAYLAVTHVDRTKAPEPVGLLASHPDDDDADDEENAA
jgi:hypothetical protein